MKTINFDDLTSELGLMLGDRPGTLDFEDVLRPMMGGIGSHPVRVRLGKVANFLNQMAEKWEGDWNQEINDCTLEVDITHDLIEIRILDKWEETSVILLESMDVREHLHSLAFAHSSGSWFEGVMIDHQNGIRATIKVDGDALDLVEAGW